MSNKDLFDAIMSRDLAKVSEMIHTDIPRCPLCGIARHKRSCEQAAQALGIARAVMDKGIAEADLRARLSLEQRSEPRESWSNIDEQSGMPKSGPL